MGCCKAELEPPARLRRMSSHPDHVWPQPAHPTAEWGSWTELHISSHFCAGLWNSALLSAHALRLRAV